MAAARATPLFDVVRLPEWDYEGPVTYIDGKIYFSLRLLSDFLDVKAQEQISRLQVDPALKRFVAQVPIKTRTGVRETWAIEKRGVGWWIATMRRDTVREEIRGRVIEFQDALIEEANRRFWSESERNPLAELRATLITLERRLANNERYSAMQEERIAELEEEITQLRALVTELEEERKRLGREGV